MSDWKTAPATDLEAAIAEFKAKLPGWYFSVCECQVSADATVAPTSESPDIQITYALPAGSKWDEGFDVALSQPATLADALRLATDEACAATAAWYATNQQDQP